MCFIAKWNLQQVKLKYERGLNIKHVCVIIECSNMTKTKWKIYKNLNNPFKNNNFLCKAPTFAMLLLLYMYMVQVAEKFNT